MTDVFVKLVLALPNLGAYAIIAVGIVMIYRASKVLNLAHGGMVMIPPYILYSLSKAGLPLVIALPLALLSGALLGLAVERIFVRRLRGTSVTTQTVGTVAALGVMVAVAARVWGTTPLRSVRIFPSSDTFIRISQSGIKYGELMLFGVMLVVTAGLLLLFGRTDLGLLMRGSAENRRAAALMGVDPDRMTAIAWIMGGALAGLAGIMLASVTNLQPYTLSLVALPAFVAALFAQLFSLPGTVVGAALVAIVQSQFTLVPGVGRAQGAPQLFLAITAIVVMARQGGRLAGSDVRAEAGAVTIDPNLPKLPGRRPMALLGLVIFLLAPLVLPFSVLGSANKAAVYIVVATSLVLLTGWVGQISLGHAALVGIGAYGTGMFAAELGIPFPLNLPLAGLLAAAVAAVLGGAAVRIRGLYLAVATLIFSWMADAYLFRQPWVNRYFRIDARPIGKEGTFPFFDFSDPKVFYFVAFATAGLTMFIASNLRDSKTGRAFFAVRGSEIAASSLGIDVVRYKLLAFCMSGFFAGVAGNLIMTEARAIVPDQFAFTVSFFYLSVAVVGGAQSLGGAVAASLVFASLNEIFFRVTALGGYLDLVSTGLLAVVLLAYQGGLARAGATLQAWLAGRRGLVDTLASADRWLGALTADLGWIRRRTAARLKQRLVLAGLALPEDARPPDEAPTQQLPVIAGASHEDGTEAHAGRVATLVRRTHADRLLHAAEHAPDPLLDYSTAEPMRYTLPPDREDRRLILKADDIVVRFGGLTAVSRMSLEVREHEIVGLIGPNGAGKSVTFNSIAGIVQPTSGRVTLYGRDVTDLPVHVRAQLGVARTFQQIQLIPQLSVFDNLMVATHLQNPTGFVTHLAVTEQALSEERRARSRVRAVVDILELGWAAERSVQDLPFGVLRMVEVARAMVTGFRFIMLDEPASGLDNTETDRLAQLLLKTRDLGVTLLLIEHDVKMVTGVSDYMYVIERGMPVAEGTPDVVKRDPAVIAAYLGEPTGEEVEA